MLGIFFLGLVGDNKTVSQYKREKREILLAELHDGTMEYNRRDRERGDPETSVGDLRECLGCTSIGGRTPSDWAGHTHV